MKISADQEKIKEILTRGVEQTIEKEHLEKALKSGKVLRIKHGIDPTGPVIHIGHAISIWKLRQLQELGHQIVLLIGDFTARIGDTSDKTALRQPLSDKEIQQNLTTCKEQLGKILDLEKTEIVYNSQWLDGLKFGEILKLASQFTVAQMIERENFTERYKQGKPIGLQEFLYPLMQGYDSVSIKSDVEVGGVDQTFNMLAGRTIQRAYGQEPQDVITLALLEGTDGRKMSKSYDNIIALNDEPAEMYGKIMSMRDELMIEYFRLCTKVLTEEINDLENELKSPTANPKDIKSRLAKEIVGLYHGTKPAQEAEKEFNRIFKEKQLPAKIELFVLQEDELPIIDLIVKTKLASSKTEAKRLIEQGAVKINQQAEKDWQKIIVIKEEEIILQVGKRKFIRIKK